ncbi:hypothetical protein [Nonomuraea sp. 10N515B]|uniref:hypothetical protein n=1 Tax=Nonomuraea sp. 10N515B TaxID=3457422 RepID=UPI003FCD6FDB
MGRFVPISQVETQKEIWTPYGPRIADIAVSDGKGGYDLIEVKGNGSNYAALQRKKDAWIAKHHGWRTQVWRFTVDC